MKKHIDYYLLISVIILIVLGLLFLATLSAPSSLKNFGTANFYLFRQLRNFVPAIVLGLIAFFIPINFIKKISPWLLVLNLIILLFVMFFGENFWGAQRWIFIFGISLQPSEFLKLTSIIYLSAWLSNRVKTEKLKGIKSYGKNIFYNFTKLFLHFVVFLSIISIILIKQPDLTTLGIIGITLLFVYFIAKTPFWHFILSIFSAIGLLYILIKIEPYRLSRLMTFLNPEADPLGAGFQVKQSLIAVGSGGIFGKGIGMSSQKFGFLPQSMTDSIFPIIAEETGIVGSCILIFLFLFFIYRGFKIAKNSSDKFSQLIAFGIVFWISTQAFINISSAIGMWPLGGIPLPFFSYGGSHLLTELVGVGFLLNISKNG